ncbi:MAG: hypothetical protein IPP36_00200 [Nitrosomonadales bacterium]|nr:hypothetical protein [Nitrosomonadales bacterium]
MPRKIHEKIEEDLVGAMAFMVATKQQAVLRFYPRLTLGIQRGIQSMGEFDAEGDTF